MWQHLEHQVIRTVVALCSCAAQAADGQVRDDARDEAAALVQLWLQLSTAHANGSDPSVFLRRWCRRVAQHLDAVAGQADSRLDSVLVAHTAVLRLEVAIIQAGGVRPVVPRQPATPTPVVAKAAPVRELGTNQRKVLEFLKTRPDARTRDLVEHFTGRLSDRTIKRCLKDLVGAKAIVRSETDGNVSYRVANA